MNPNTIYLLFLFNFLLIRLNAQIPPDNGTIYDDTEIVKIKIEIDPDSLNQMLTYENLTSDHEYPARFIFIHSTIDTVEEIGFRLRGNTSRFSAKKSFKISFNSFYSGRKFLGMEKLNLNGEHNDPSIIRTKLSFNLYKKAGLAAPRSAHVELYINGEYKGLYINVEMIDDEFTESRFGNKNGNLYKCLYPATLEYINDNPDSYKFMADGRRVYELVTNQEQDDYSDLAQFIAILNNTPIADLDTELEPVFNVNAYLKHLALEILTGHWDGYSYNMNNFYLYHNTLTGKFEFLPYDIDNTFGIDWMGQDWAIRNIYNWANSTQRPLTIRLLQNQVYRDRFSFYMKDILDNFFNPTFFFPEIDAIKTMISSSAEADLYRTYDYGWDIADFHNSYTQALGGHVAYGLKPYITTRYNYANNQLILNPISPIIRNITYTKLFTNKDFEVFAYVEDEDDSPNVVLHYKVNSGSLIDLVMVDNGSGNDLYPGDKVFSALVSAPLTSPGNLEFNISATDISANTSFEPINGMYILTIPENSNVDLFLNEIMAANSSRVHDSYGEFDDWVEIYNGGTESIWLGDKYLSDDYTVPNKWQMPDVEIFPGDFKLFWCDNQTWQGIDHTSFKLSANGEEIGIFDSESTGFAQIDFTTFGIQQSNVSIGRLPDGQGSIIFLPYATPGYSNMTPISIIEPLLDDEVKVYPNPLVDGIHIEINGVCFGVTTIRIIDLTGRIRSEHQYSKTQNRMYLSKKELNTPPGMYILNIVCENQYSSQKTVNKLIVVK
jgi:spore coat protein H